MASDNVPKAISESTIEVFGVQLRVIQLDDGRRIIDAEDLDTLFAKMDLEGEGIS